MKIRALRTHLVPHAQDHKNAQQIKLLTYKRKRCFEYLKRTDLVRYRQCLMETGVDKRAVEGELVIHRWWCVPLFLFLLVSAPPPPVPSRRRTTPSLRAHVPGSARRARRRHDEQPKTHNKLI